jgi:ParB-like chromosome segregation protein Spo0J
MAGKTPRPVSRLSLTEMLSSVQVPIDALVTDEENARVHGERNIDALKKSLQKFGQVEPLLIRKKTKRLIAGHGRLQAMQDLGFTHVAVVELDITDKHARALAIALNRTAELAEWNYDSLASLLAQLPDDDLELPDVGFTQAELTAMLVVPGDAPEEKKRKPSTRVTVSVTCDPEDAPELFEKVEALVEKLPFTTDVKMR